MSSAKERHDTSEENDYLNKLDGQDANLNSLLLDYYRIRIRAEQLFNKRDKRDEYLKLFADEENEDREKFRSVVKEFRERMGLEDIFYCVTDQKEDSIHIFKNRNIDNRHKESMLLLLDPELYAGAKQSVQDEKALLDLIYESEEEFIRLLSKNDAVAPYYLRNLPPFESNRAIPTMPFETKWRKKRSVNYMYAYCGESTFFTYVYAYFIDRIRHSKRGFFHEFKSIDPVIKNYRKAPYQIWQLKHWWDAGFQNSPEVRWLKVIEKKEKYEHYAASSTFESIRETWERIKEENELVTTDYDHFSFIDRRWRQMGLSGMENEEEAERLLTSLLSYAVHVFKNADYRYWLNGHFLSNVDEAWRSNLDALLVLFDPLTEERDKEAKIKERLEDLKRFPEGVHYFVMLAGIQAFLPKEKGMVTKKRMLEEVHRRSRFTVFQAYFQLTLSPYDMPVEHFYFPVFKSMRYEAEFVVDKNDDAEAEHGRRKTPFVVVCCATLKPIWQLDSNYNITENAEYYLFEKGAKVSVETMVRLNLINDFVRLLSTAFVDDFFYGRVVEKEASSETRNVNFENQVHESKPLIDRIHHDTPESELRDIRLYFHVIFQRAKGVIRDYIKGKKNVLPVFFEFGDDYEDLISRACLMALNIQFVAEGGRSKDSEDIYSEYHKVREIPDKWEKKEAIYNLLMRYSIRVEAFNQFKSDAFDQIEQLKREDAKGRDIDDEKIRHLSKHAFFFMAIVCGIRNAIKHSDEGSEIVITYRGNQEYEGIERYFEISNKPKEENKIDAQKTGSTTASLWYYVKEYLEDISTFREFTEDKFFPKREAQENFLTIIPYPNF